MLFGGVEITREDHITRTTLYLESHLHNKAKEAGINLSKEVANYLETILFGDEVGDVQYQLQQVDERIETLNGQLSSLKSRREQLVAVISEHDAKAMAEHSIYKKFLNHSSNIISNVGKGHSIDFSRLKHHWKRDYFSDNGNLTEKLVKNVLNKIETNKFTFENFQQLRRGGVFGN